MGNRTLKEWIIRSAILMAGLIIAHFGVTLFLLSDLGSDPFNVLIQGITGKLTQNLGLSFLTHGRVHMGICILIMLILTVIDRSYVKIGTILCMLCGGPIIDAFTWMLGPAVSVMNSLAARLVMVALGCVILAFGMTVVIKSDAGTGPNDLVAVVISDKLKLKFSITRLIVDALFTLAGFLMGGTAGIGTLICVALVGPVAGIFLPINERNVERIISRFQS
ncbi:MAG: hypothetical protein J6P87_07950 [Lachnospiraceae bacterium]|nr:hypothetical protein [Lachnospiraceae bacterium]